MRESNTRKLNVFFFDAVKDKKDMRSIGIDGPENVYIDGMLECYQSKKSDIYISIDQSELRDYVRLYLDALKKSTNVASLECRKFDETYIQLLADTLRDNRTLKRVKIESPKLR